MGPPDWLQWAAALATVIGTGLFAGVAIWLAAWSLSLTRWQRTDRETANVKNDLEQRVGHACVVGELDDASALLSAFPQDVPSEPRSERRRRLRCARAQGDVPNPTPAAYRDFQTFVFSLQPDGRWTLANFFNTHESTLAALNQVLLSYQLPEAETAEDDPLVPLWVSGQTYLVYTRLAPRSGRRQK